MVGSTVGTVVGGRYCTVRYFSRPVLSPLLLMMRVIIGAASCPMRVPYRTVRWRCLVTVVLVTVRYSYSCVAFIP